MKIVVTSHNPVKIAAVKEAFLAQFPSVEQSLTPRAVNSEVSEQPMSDEETRNGARNRVKNARLEHPDADFWVGLEGGLDMFDDQMMAFAWMVISNRDGYLSETRSATLPLPPAVTLIPSPTAANSMAYTACLPALKSSVAWMTPVSRPGRVST